MMKARADNRRLFERGVQLNMMALVDNTDFDAERVIESMMLADHGLKPGDLTEPKRLFEHATTFGSLIQVPGALAEMLATQYDTQVANPPYMGSLSDVNFEEVPQGALQRLRERYFLSLYRP